jgi:hypothetical protein
LVVEKTESRWHEKQIPATLSDHHNKGGLEQPGGVNRKQIAVPAQVAVDKSEGWRESKKRKGEGAKTVTKGVACFANLSAYKEKYRPLLVTLYFARVQLSRGCTKRTLFTLYKYVVPSALSAEYNFHEAAMHAGRCVVDDIDERISERVWKYRFPNEDVPLKDKEKLSRLVHTRFKSNRPELAASAINVQAQMPTIVDLWMYQDIFAAWDEKTTLVLGTFSHMLQVCPRPEC